MNSPPPHVDREEVRAFCWAMYGSLKKALVEIDVTVLARIADPAKHPVTNWTGRGDDSPEAEVERRIALAEAVKAGLEAAIRARTKVSAERAARKPKARPMDPVMPPGWSYAEPQENRPRREPGVDHASKAWVIARRGKRRLLYRENGSTPGTPWPAALVLDHSEGWPIDGPGSPDRCDKELHAGRLKASTFADHIEEIRAYLAAPPLRAGWLDRNRTLVIPE